jgi:hypothetical protein
MITLEDWLIKENASRTSCKLGLYPEIYSILGQYPPLYAAPKAADFITYYYIQYGAKGAPTKNGIVNPKSL